jgi:hypothetical protein
MPGEEQPLLNPPNPESEPKDPAERIITWAERYHEKWEAGAAARQSLQQEQFQPQPEVLDELRSYFTKRQEAITLGREAYTQSKSVTLEEKMKTDAEYELAAQMLDEHPSEERIQLLQEKLRHRLWQQQRERVLEKIRETVADAPPRNILEYFEETADAIADIEGDAWAALQATDAKFWGDETMPQHYETLIGVLTHFQKHPPGTIGQQVLYGDGGCNRWYIAPDGDVGFSKSHAVPSTGDTKESLLKKVEALGFQVL